MEIDEDKVRQDWAEYEGQFQLKSIATHYGIYEHLFGHAFFLPRVALDIQVMNDAGDGIASRNRVSFVDVFYVCCSFSTK